MCEQFAAEASAYNDQKGSSTLRGFAAALAGKEMAVPPEDNYAGYKDAWVHGWNCFQERLLPWHLELRVYKDNRAKANEASTRFRETGSLSSEVLSLLNNS